MPIKSNNKQQSVAKKAVVATPSPAKKQQSIAKQQPIKQQPVKQTKSTTPIKNNNNKNNNKSLPKKSNKKQQDDEENEENEFDDADLKKQLQDMISSGNFDDEDFDSEDEEDDDQDVMDFDDSEDEEVEEDDEEVEEDGEEVEEDDQEEELEDEDEIDEDEEIEELEDQLVDDLYDEMNEGESDQDEEEEEEEEEKVPTIQMPTKKLSKNIQMSGQAFQGVARVEDYLKQEALKPKKKPEMIRELNPEDELVETSDLSADEEEDQEDQEQEEQPKELTNNKYIVNDKEGINNKLRELKLANGKIPWVHTLAVTSQQPLELEDVHDDFKREIAFYKQTLQSVTECEKLCADHGLIVRRKPDFFAEMVKSDEQMHKIKANIQSEKKRVETSEAIRKKREIKKFGKQVQTQKLLERQKQKSDAIESVKKWRKNREKGNVSDEFNIDLIDDVNNNKKDKKKVEKSQLAQKSDKRKKKDAKYGFGGKKRFAKTNDKSSINDMSSFSLKRNNEDKDYSRGKGSKMNKGGRGGSRPGKSRRSRK